LTLLYSVVNAICQESFIFAFMTAAQSFKIYEVLGKHFNNAEDAKIVVTEIEQIIESKIADKKKKKVSKSLLIKIIP